MLEEWQAKISGGDDDIPHEGVPEAAREAFTRLQRRRCGDCGVCCERVVRLNSVKSFFGTMLKRRTIGDPNVTVPEELNKAHLRYRPH
jgi:hypothetical protein